MSLTLMDSYNPTVQALQKQNKRLRAENKKLKSEISVQSYWGLRWEKEHAENERLKARCFPSKIVMIEDSGHYVSESVFAEIERLKAELAEVKKDAERLKGLRELCGYVEDGSSQTMRITQDDATKDWIIRWNDKAGWVFSSSFNGAIDAAMEGK